MQCIKCGKDNPIGSQYCNGCGVPVTTYLAQPVLNADQKPALKIFAAIGGVVLLVILISSLRGNNSDTASTSTFTATPQSGGSISLPSPTVATESAASNGLTITPPVEKVKWTGWAGTSEMDSSPSYTLSLKADNSIEGWPNKKVTPILIIRCKERSIDLYVQTGMAATVEYGGGNTVRIRLDDKQPITQKWVESTDNEALFSQRAMEIARKISQAKTMLFEFTPFNSTTVIAQFDVRGLSDLLGKVESACAKKKK
ncbi:MAG: hypothetical protein WBV94_24725 [Blastocatellia bacterium]